MNAYKAFRQDASPANAVSLALNNFTVAHGCADNDYTDALRLAERQLRDRQELIDCLEQLVEGPYPDGICHKGICSEDRCGRCSRHARARAALKKAGL